MIDGLGFGGQMSHERFLRLFPTDAACLEYLKDRFYPDGSHCPGCGRPSKFHRLSGRSAYSCQFCGAQVYPAAGTVFSRSATPLQLWFWAVFLTSSTRGRISAAELERELGVTRRTAQRIAHQIRDLLEEEAAGERSEVPALSQHGVETRGRRIWNAGRRRG